MFCVEIHDSPPPPACITLRGGVTQPGVTPAAVLAAVRAQSAEPSNRALPAGAGSALGRVSGLTAAASSVGPDAAAAAAGFSAASLGAWDEIGLVVAPIPVMGTGCWPGP